MQKISKQKLHHHSRSHFLSHFCGHFWHFRVLILQRGFFDEQKLKDQRLGKKKPAKRKYVYMGEDNEMEENISRAEKVGLSLAPAKKKMK